MRKLTRSDYLKVVSGLVAIAGIVLSRAVSKIDLEEAVDKKLAEREAELESPSS